MLLVPLGRIVWVDHGHVVWATPAHVALEVVVIFPPRPHHTAVTGIKGVAPETCQISVSLVAAVVVIMVVDLVLVLVVVVVVVKQLPVPSQG